MSGRLVPCGHAIGVEAHVLFGVCKGPFFLVLVVALQNRPAQQGQLLQSNSMFPRQRDVNSYCEWHSYQVHAFCRDTFKREDTESHILSESV